MRVLGIIQARMSSVRCPGKVLRAVEGQPLLDYLVARLRNSRKLNGLLIATSRNATDNLIEAYCRQKGLECFRGELDNVAGRFCAAIEKMGASAFVRINGDSPWMDENLVDRAVTLFQSQDLDLVTNVWKRSFPRGESIEVFKSSVYLQAYSQMKNPEDREHVSSYFYKNPSFFKMLNFQTEDGQDYSSINLCVDTEEDFRKFEAAVWKLGAQEAVKRPWQAIVKLYEQISKHEGAKR